jgi:hypothetical protein
MTILNLRQGGGNKVNVLVHSFLRYSKKWKSCERETGDLKQKLLNGYQTLGYTYSVNGLEQNKEKVNIFLWRFVNGFIKVFK